MLFKISNIIVISWVCVGFSLSSFAVNKNVDDKSWGILPGSKIYEILGWPDVDIEASAGLSWPDGKQATMLYINDHGCLYKCIEYFDKDMQATGEACYMLKNPPKVSSKKFQFKMEPRCKGGD